MNEYSDAFLSGYNRYNVVGLLSKMIFKFFRTSEKRHVPIMDNFHFLYVDILLDINIQKLKIFQNWIIAPYFGVGQKI